MLYLTSDPLHLAKQKLEDRLAAAAREKLAQASKESKEKQLQAERKRKAALFLQTLRNPLTGEPETRRPDKTTAMPEVWRHTRTHCGSENPSCDEPGIDVLFLMESLNQPKVGAESN